MVGGLNHGLSNDVGETRELRIKWWNREISSLMVSLTLTGLAQDPY